LWGLWPVMTRIGADDSDTSTSGPRPGAPVGETVFGFGVAELLVVLGVVLFMFGRGRLSRLGDNFRGAIRNFKVMAQGGWGDRRDSDGPG
jgi:mttA/Hcf106 family